MLHGHGNDIFTQSSKIKVDFSSNVMYTRINKRLLKHLKSTLGSIKNYPEAGANMLQHSIARYLRVDPREVVVTNGSTEAFYMIAQLLAKSHSSIVIPSFAEYEDAARCHGHSIEYIPREQILSKQTLNPGCAWVGNPNNPDGAVLNPQFITDLSAANPTTHFIIDEAYTDLCTGKSSSMGYLSSRPNIVITRSLTKVFSIPGLRLGYIVAAKRFCDQLREIRIPWSVNSMAIEAGLFIMKHHDSLIPSIEPVLRESERVQRKMAQIPGVSVIPSCTNYFLACLQQGNAMELKQHLVATKGYLIRDASNFKGLTPAHFRVSVNLPLYNNQLVKAIKTWILTR